MRLSLFLFLLFLTPLLRAQVSKSDALALFHNLKDREYEEFMQSFDSSLLAKVSPYQIKLAWEKIVQSSGSFQDTLDFKFEDIAFKQSWLMGMAFEKDTVDIALVFNKKNKLVGFFQRPYSQKLPYTLPSYAREKDFTEIPFVLVSGAYKLPGILTLSNKAKGKSPILILAHGSGPNSRDETIGPNPVFKDLAYGLASKGIATFRYDKRSLVYGSKMSDNPDSFTVWEEVINDILSAVDTFSSDKRFSGVYVLGHSLSAYLVPRVAEKRPKIQGIISAAGPARPLQTLLLEQYKYLQAIDEDPDEWIYSIKQLTKKVAFLESDDFSYDAQSESLPLSLPAAYWLDLKKYDPVQTALNAGVPMMVIQGKKDYQVLMSDFEVWKSGLSTCKACQFKAYEQLGHGLFEGADVPGPKQYEAVDHVRKDVIQDIAKFIKANRP